MAKKVGKQQRGKNKTNNSKKNSNAGRPPKYKTPEELQKKVDEYFESGAREREVIIGAGASKRVVKVKMITVSGLAYYLGFESRQSLHDYQTNPDFAYIVKKARLFIEMQYEELLHQGNVTGAIFALKNMGWRDQPKDDQEPGKIKLTIE